MRIAEERNLAITSTDETIRQQAGENRATGELKNINARFSVLFAFDQSHTQYGDEQFLIRIVVL